MPKACNHWRYLLLTLAMSFSKARKLFGMSCSIDSFALK
uniref:Uncharacterized protein n=1 Tax=Rhizophora mucronata TaxID=61149 RepID=A0A2P2ITN3_RHIMU